MGILIHLFPLYRPIHQVFRFEVGEPHIFQDAGYQFLSHTTHAADCPSKALDTAPTLESQRFPTIHTDLKTVEAKSFFHHAGGLISRIRLKRDQ